MLAAGPKALSGAMDTVLRLLCCGSIPTSTTPSESTGPSPAAAARTADDMQSSSQHASSQQCVGLSKEAPDQLVAAADSRRVAASVSAAAAIQGAGPMSLSGPASQGGSAGSAAGWEGIRRPLDLPICDLEDCTPEQAAIDRAQGETAAQDAAHWRTMCEQLREAADAAQRALSSAAQQLNSKAHISRTRPVMAALREGAAAVQAGTVLRKGFALTQQRIDDLVWVGSQLQCTASSTYEQGLLTYAEVTAEWSEPSEFLKLAADIYKLGMELSGRAVLLVCCWCHSGDRSDVTRKAVAGALHCTAQQADKLLQFLVRKSSPNPDREGWLTQKLQQKAEQQQ